MREAATKKARGDSESSRGAKLTTRRAGWHTRVHLCSRPLHLWIRFKTLFLYDRIPQFRATDRLHTRGFDLLSLVLVFCCRCLASPKIWWPFVVPSWTERPTSLRRPWAEGSTALSFSLACGLSLEVVADRYEGNGLVVARGRVLAEPLRARGFVALWLLVVTCATIQRHTHGLRRLFFRSSPPSWRAALGRLTY